jgi:putative addiction module CopG family antidote
MNIDLAPADEKFIRESISRGLYRSESDAISDIVRRAREAEEGKMERLLALLKIGDDEITAGHGIPYTPDFIKESAARARRMVADGVVPPPEVCP